MLQFRFSRTLFIIPLAILAFLLCKTTAWADSSGRCGDTVIWSFSESSGTLTISGSGNMDDWYLTDYYSSKLDDYFVGSSAPWWYSNYEKIKSVIIYEGVTSIGTYAFWKCENLTSVTIPVSVTQIGEQAFSNCKKLASVTIPAGVTSISQQTFWYCSSLTSVVIPDGVTSIGSGAFSYCSNLTSLKIPSSVVNTDNGFLSGCDGLITAGPIGSGCNCEFGWAESIPDYAFCGFSALTSVTIPESVTSIGRFAFSSCSSLTSVEIPNGVSIIDKNTFAHCNSLKSITIPNAVTIINDQAFSSCSSLESVTIPENMILIGNYAFYGCSSLADVYFNGTMLQWNTITKGANNTPLLNATIHFGSDIPETYSVIYDANGGTGAPEAQEKKENVTLTLSSIQPARESIGNGSITVGLNLNDGNNTQFSLTTTKWITYAFIEWNTMADGGGTSYASGADYTANEAITLFAQWETSTIGDPVMLLTPSRDGYVFRGWATSRDATVGIIGDYVPTDNVTLYAVWVAPDLVLPS